MACFSIHDFNNRCENISADRSIDRSVTGQTYFSRQFQRPHGVTPRSWSGKHLFRPPDSMRNYTRNVCLKFHTTMRIFVNVYVSISFNAAAIKSP